MPSLAPARSTNSASGEPLGVTVPRLWTPPLRELTPETSYGFDVIDFADQILGITLDEWQQWLLIHMGELLEDGRPRFRIVLVMVARQQGKTLLLKILTLYWLYVERQPLVMATSSTRAYAKATWVEVCDLAQSNEHLRGEITAIHKAIMEEALIVEGGATYSFSAATGNAGRSRTISRLILDELRQHKSFDTWAAASNATNAVPGAQIVAITNQGDDTSVVLDSLRDPAVQYIETGEGDRRLGLFEWSAPPGCEPDDIDALAAANPSLGRRTDVDTLVGAALRAKAAGGLELAQFRTEILCQRVALLDPAIDPDLWKAAGTDKPVDLAKHRDKVVLCIDISLDGSHASLVAAAVVDGLVHLDVVAAWSGYGCSKAVRAELPGIVRRVRPRAVGWYPNGPASVLAADMAAKRTSGWPPRRVTLEAINGEVTTVCMSLADLVMAGEVVHSDDPMLTAHVESAQKLRRGDRWSFTRRGTGPVDGAYAAAGAAHLARILPEPPPPLAAL